MKGVRTATQNRSWPNEITLAVPDKLLLVANTPQAVIRQILAGNEGWILNGSKLQTLPAEAALNARRGLQETFAVVKATSLPGMQYVGIKRSTDAITMWSPNQLTTKLKVTTLMW